MMDILEHAYNQALFQNEEEIEKWRRCITEYMCVKERLETFRNELSLKIMVPLGSKALIRGKLYHTNEVLVHLGDGWFTKQSTHQALEICDRRIKNAEAILQEYEVERSWLMNKKDIPKSHDIFSNNEHKEIIEDFDEDAEKEWRKRHTENVKTYHQQLAKQREADKDDDEKYWERLEELEIQEEFERELEKLNSLDYSQNRQDNHSDIIAAFKTDLGEEVNIAIDNKNADFNSESTKKWIDENLSEFTSDSEHSLSNSKSNNSILASSSKRDEANAISEVELLERKSNVEENLPVKMKLSYDFIGAFENSSDIDESLSVSDDSGKSVKRDLQFEDRSITCNQASTNFTNLRNPCIRNTKVNNRLDAEKITNVKLLHRESNINENFKDIQFSEDIPNIIPRLNISSEKGPISNETSMEKSGTCNIINNEMKEDKLKYDLLENYKRQLVEITNILNSTTIKSHYELCKQLDNYDMIEELEHEITLLQDELNIANDNSESDSSDNSDYETVSVPSEKSLKRVSFTEKDHTKYLDDECPDPPLILNFKHSTHSPIKVESKSSNEIESPYDIYRLYKNCFVSNEKPYKSILKKTSDNIKLFSNGLPFKEEPCVGDSSKTQVLKKNVQLKSRAIVIGDVSENKSDVITSDTKINPSTKVPMSRFKSMRNALK